MRESARRTVNVKVAMGLPVANAELCDLRERPLEQLDVADNGFGFRIKPFELLTVRVRVS